MNVYNVGENGNNLPDDIKDLGLAISHLVQKNLTTISEVKNACGFLEDFGFHNFILAFIPNLFVNLLSISMQGESEPVIRVLGNEMVDILSKRLRDTIDVVVLDNSPTKEEN
jgi:hypothetical protein